MIPPPMPRLLVPVLLGCLLAVPSLRSADGTPAPVLKASQTEALEALDGKRAIVLGRVREARKTPSGINKIAFEDAEFELVTFKSDLAAFRDGEPADLFAGKILRVSGVITLYRGKPQIKLTEPSMVEIIDSDEVPEPPPPVAAEARPVAEAAPAAAATKEIAAEKPRPPVDWRLYFK
ncbi:MAG: hypothetical protein R3F31_13015 [Verrucomicrobiales bacterium]|nr:OB-fold nucleic acid binding domain-containing protein [Akkermansiaceae bacterium]HRX52977.1 hypothetical protein [Verrucomicrobiales bacterium]